MGQAETIFYIILVIWIYFLPWIKAWQRGHSKTSAIGVLNLLFGWTFIGWGIAMVWAYTEKKEKIRHAQ